jgi:four helix bundle protein
MMQDLKKRTFDFSLRVMRLAEALPDTRSGRTIANQLVRSGTSVGANYRAAKRAKSTKDFISKMGTVEEECDETIYWIELAVAVGCIDANLVDSLLKEANEILAITVSSIKTAKGKANTKANAKPTPNSLPNSALPVPNSEVQS